jgi:hypothetical protein
MHRSSVAPSAEQFPTKMRQNQSPAVARAVVIAIQELAEGVGISVNARPAFVYSARMLDAFGKTV